MIEVTVTDDDRALLRKELEDEIKVSYGLTRRRLKDILDQPRCIDKFLMHALVEHAGHNEVVDKDKFLILIRLLLLKSEFIQFIITL